MDLFFEIRGMNGESLKMKRNQLQHKLQMLIEEKGTCQVRKRRGRNARVRLMMTTKTHVSEV
jgi:hypothetical protein